MKKEIEPGIGDIPERGIFGISQIDRDLLEINWVPPKGRGLTGRKFFVGLGATGGLLALTGCVPLPIPPTETPIATETTGIPPTPTLEITSTPTEVPTATPIPEPTKTPTPEPIPTITPEAFRDELKLSLGGEWEEVRFGEEIVGYRINNLEFVLPNFEVPVENWDAQHFLIEKSGKKIASLVALGENQIARFNQQGKFEIYQDGQLITTLNPDVSWALKPGKYVGDTLRFEGKDLMVRIKTDQGAGEKPLVEAFDPETLKIVKSSLPKIIESHLIVGGVILADPAVERRLDQKLGREWSISFPTSSGYYVEIAKWRAGEPVELTLARMKIEEFKGFGLIGFPEDKSSYLQNVLSWFEIADPVGWEYIKMQNIQWILYRVEAGYGGCTYNTIILPDKVLPPSEFASSPDAQKANLCSILVHESVHATQLVRGEALTEKEPCLNQIECLKRLKQVKVSDDPEKQAMYEYEIQGRIGWLEAALLPGNYCNP